MTKNLILLFICFFISKNLFSQNIKNYFEEQKNPSFQKLYLHTDRDFYFLGDTLWFSGYLLDAQTHLPFEETCNLYLDIANKKGEFLYKEMFPIEKGFCEGAVILNFEDLVEGNYLLRAFTDQLKTFGEELFFTKTINVCNIKSVLNNEAEELKKDTGTIHLDFFPEGGFLLADKINQMAFKAYKENGMEVEVKGKLLDQKGNEVIDFKSLYMGMGRLFFIPAINEKYRIEVDGYKKVNYEFPQIKQNGSKLMLTGLTSVGFNLNILTSYQAEFYEYYIAILHRGEGINMIKVHSPHIDKTITIKTKSLKNGINRIVLLNKHFEPVSERLLLVDKENILPFELELKENEFATREKVEINIKKQRGFKQNEIVHLSVAVVNENSIAATGVSQNIKSFLLADSELKGHITNPADFFTDDESVKSIEKLNLLMMVNGWSNYIWNTLQNNQQIDFFEPKFGMEIKGTLKKPLTNKPLKYSKVTFTLINEKETNTYKTYTDNKGDFKFKNIQFYDSATVFIQGKNQRDKTNTFISVNDFEIESPLITEYDLSKMENFSNIPTDFYRMRYMNKLAMNAYYPENNTQLIEEVEVVEMIFDDGHSRHYVNPNYSFAMNESFRRYNSLFQLLPARFPSIMYINGRIISRRKNVHGDDVAFLMDGVQVSGYEANTIDLDKIDKIEMLVGLNALYLGLKTNESINSRSSKYTTVISILTKSKGKYVPEPVAIPGTIVKRIKCYTPYREFYSPVYTAENIYAEAPDYRTTLYWNPSVKMDLKTKNLSFFTCDNLARYKVIVEGISETGKICLGEASFTVNTREKNKKLSFNSSTD